MSWNPGDLATWLHTARGGYGYVTPVDALVLKVGAARVQVQVKRVDGTVVARWVAPNQLRPRVAAATSGDSDR